MDFGRALAPAARGEAGGRGRTRSHHERDEMAPSEEPAIDSHRRGRRNSADTSTVTVCEDSVDNVFPAILTGGQCRRIPSPPYPGIADEISESFHSGPEIQTGSDEAGAISADASSFLGFGFDAQPQDGEESWEQQGRGRSRSTSVHDGDEMAVMGCDLGWGGAVDFGTKETQGSGRERPACGEEDEEEDEGERYGCEEGR